MNHLKILALFIGFCLTGALAQPPEDFTGNIPADVQASIDEVQAQADEIAALAESGDHEALTAYLEQLKAEAMAEREDILANIPEDQRAHAEEALAAAQARVDEARAALEERLQDLDLPNDVNIPDVPDVR